MAHDVYVSYSHNDKAIADAVVDGLENNHIRCWMAPRDISSGSSLADAIIKAIEGSKIMVIILSGNSNRSNQIVREVERAVANNVIIIPFRIEEMQPFGALAYYLSSEHWIDAITNNLDENIQNLTDHIQDILGVGNKSNHPMSEIVDSDNEVTKPSRGLSNIFGIRKKDLPKKTLNADNAITDNQGGQFQAIDTIEVKSATSQGLIRFCVGDPTNTGLEENVDVLIVWSPRDDYSPISGSMINTLNQKGISLKALAMDKEVDLRQAFSCWLSREITKSDPEISFKRILCYEPDESAKAAELVGDIFRSLAPFLGGSFPIRSVATPLLASGQLMKNKRYMLQQLVEAAAHWMSSGLPLDSFNIISYPDSRLDELTQVFSELKTRYTPNAPQKKQQFSYDYFVSYSHKDTREVDMFIEILLGQNKDLRVFIDKKNLNPGSAWQREIYESIDDCRNVAAFYSPTYLDSKVCIEEFNIALCRHRESDEPILKPIYLYSANLPTYMRLVQFFDCRESNPERIKQAVNQLLVDAV
jgi:hypothetical protein